MHYRDFSAVAIAGALLSTPFLTSNAQETVAANSEQLGELIATYAANGMDEEIVSTFAVYLSRPQPVEDPYCAYCQALIGSIVHSSGENPLVRLLFDATDSVVDEAFANLDGDTLMRLAVMTGASAARENRDRSLYFLLIAAQLGIDDEWRDEVVQVLANAGLSEDALAVARSIHESPDSVHYQSDQMQTWINYLSEEVERNQQLGAIIAAAATQ